MRDLQGFDPEVSTAKVGKMDIQLKHAELSEIDNVLKLHSRYQIDSIAEEDKPDGFVTTAFTKKQLTDLINKENGLFIAKQNGVVVAYVMAASWSFWASSPVQAYMINNLSSYEFKGVQLSTTNSYQYGPVCIDKSHRGSGLLEKIFSFALDNMSKRYPILVTFVNQINPRSLRAHTGKLGLSDLGKFEFNNNTYSWLCYSTEIA